MQAVIYSLCESEIDKFICQEADYYAVVTRKATDEDPTVDLQITINCIAVSDEHIIIEFPSGSILHVIVNSCMYFKIEVI